MRDSVFFEVRLRRFDVWQTAVVVVAAGAIATLAAWALAMLDSQEAPGRALVVSLAVVLALATIAIAFSLARNRGGVLACRAGAWSFVMDTGAHAGTLEVAIDLGGFLLLRLRDPRRAVWLPVQRRGLETEWHALRCAVYWPPPPATGSSTVSPLTPE